MRGWQVWGISGVVLALWLSWVFQSIFVDKLGLPAVVERGQWGDTFGALNALFAAVGFIAVLITLRFQQRQIQDARQEQERLTKEDREERHKQRFESSFFQLLDLLREIRREAVFHHTDEYDALMELEDEEFIGSGAFEAAWREFVHTLNKHKPSADAPAAAKIYETVVHNRYEYAFSPFFRVLYTMLRNLRDDSILSKDEKDNYSRLVRSQMTSFEIALTGANGLSKVSGRLSELLTEFHMLKYLPNGPRRTAMRRFYPDQAFSSRN